MNDFLLLEPIKLGPIFTFFSHQVNNNDEKIDDGSEVEEEEEDFLVLGVNDDDKIGMFVDEENEEEETAKIPSDKEENEEEDTTKIPSDTEKKRTSLKRDQVKKKKKKKQKKHKKDRKEEVAGPSTSAEEVPAAKRRRRRERLEAPTEKERLTEDLGDKMFLKESSVYSMGNYCSTMLAGQKCEETSCSWSHVMMARDAANQFSKILQFR